MGVFEGPLQYVGAVVDDGRVDRAALFDMTDVVPGDSLAATPMQRLDDQIYFVVVLHEPLRPYGLRQKQGKTSALTVSGNAYPLRRRGRPVHAVESLYTMIRRPGCKK